MALNNSLINTWGLKIRRTRLKQLSRFGIDFPIKSDPTERGTHFFHAPTFLLQCGMRMFVIRGARISCPESIARAWAACIQMELLPESLEQQFAKNAEGEVI